MISKFPAKFEHLCTNVHLRLYIHETDERIAQFKNNFILNCGLKELIERSLLSYHEKLLIHLNVSWCLSIYVHIANFRNQWEGSSQIRLSSITFIIPSIMDFNEMVLKIAAWTVDNNLQEVHFRWVWKSTWP